MKFICQLVGISPPAYAQFDDVTENERVVYTKTILAIRISKKIYNKRIDGFLECLMPRTAAQKQQ